VLRAAAGASPEVQSEVVAGLSTALAGWRKARRPDGWDAFKAQLAASTPRSTRDQARGLDVLFGDGRALAEVRRLALDEHAGIEVRKSALKTLIESRPPDLRSICERLLRVQYLNVIALRGLALYDEPALGKTLAQNYRAFHQSERAAVLDTLVSRPVFARALLDQVAAGRIPRADITPFHARQIASSGDPALARRLAQVWGELRVSAADRRERMSALKSRLGPTVLDRADLPRGRATFDRVCGSCHKLYGDGGDIGPDLTGSGRNNLDYLLENIVDPSAVVTADFRMAVIAMKDGRILNGIVKRQTEKSLTLQTQTEAIVIERSEIETLRPSSSSLMPDGLLDNLNPDEIRDLIAYLAHQTQVPRASTEAGAPSLGKSR
jgi:putative heme-binding domain-containing protein